MKVIDSLYEIADGLDVFFIDVYGVLWSGEKFYEKALSVCEKLIKAQKKIYVLSNSTMISGHFKEKYAPRGFLQGIHYTDVITSGDVLKQMLEKDNFLDKVVGSSSGKYYLLGAPNDLLLHCVLDRQTNDINQASAVYVGSLQVKKNGVELYSPTIEPFIVEAQQALEKGLPAICANPDYFAFRGEVKYVAQGNLARWYEENGGLVYWIGKPYKDIYTYALDKVQDSPSKCAMVGDTIRTDILGGFNAQMKTVLILGTGISQDKLNHGESLETLAKKEGAFPDYILMKGLE